MTYGMNDIGDVVGLAERADGTSAPYVYSVENGMQDLNRLIPNTLQDSPREMVWGPDFNEDGNSDLYVASALTDEVIAYDGQTGDVLGVFVESGSGGLDGPHAMAFAGGYLYVSGRGSDALHRYDDSTGTYVDTFIPTQSAGLDDPVDFAFGPDGHLYVISQNTNEILKFSSVDGSFIEVFIGDDPLTVGIDETGGVDEPFSLLFANGVVYLASWSNEILLYDESTGEFLGVFVGDDPSTPDLDESGGLEGPRGMTFGPDGHLYVANGGGHTTPRHSVLRYDGSTGEFIDQFVAEQSNGIRVPMHVLFDASGNLLVTSSATDRILVYEGPSGTSPGTFIDGYVPGSGWILISAKDINNDGQIVGYGAPRGAFGEPSSSAYRYTPAEPGELFGTVENLEVPGPQSARATAINNDGDVVGIFTVNSVWHSFLWMDGDPLGYQDLGTLSGMRTLAVAINDRDTNGQVQITGYGDTPEGTRAWRYDSSTGVMNDLGVLNTKGGSQKRSFGLDISNTGDVAGHSSVGRYKSRAIIADTTGNLQDLGTLGGDSSCAHGINDFGDIVGMAQESDGVYTAFGYLQSTGMYALEPQVIGLDPTRILDGLVLPWRINLFGQICGPGEDGFNFYNIHGEAYVITPIP